MSRGRSCGKVDAMVVGKQRVAGSQVVLLITLVAVPWVLSTRSGQSANAAFAWRLANTGVALVVGHAVFALQLAGNLAGARLVGDRIVLARLGFGPVLYARARVMWRFTVHAIPGDVITTLVTRRERGQRLRTFATALCGVLAVAGAIWLVRTIEGTSVASLRSALASRPAPDAIFVLFGYALLVMLALALFDIAVGGSGIKPETYRARLALAPALDADVALERGAFAEALTAVRTGLERYPHDDLLHVTLANVLSAANARDAFAAVDALRMRPLTPPLRAIANRLYAWELYLRNDAENRDAARNASEAAVHADPASADNLAIHGCILVWHGELAAAEPLLVRGFTGSRARITRAAAATAIARLCARTHRIALATTWLEHARAQDILHDLVAAVAAEIEPLRRV